MFPEGSPIIVTYYHQNISQIDIRTAPTDISLLGHPVHKDFTKIMNFEFRLLDQLNSEFNDEDNSFHISGEALFYPGFNPYIGDIFLLDLGDNKIGEFKLNNVTPTSYRQGKYHRVVFEILTYVTAEVLQLLEEGVRDTVYFNKNVYVGEGDYVFLKHESYLQLQELKKKRKELLQFYTNEFYREEWESFVRPDEIYDPYLVEFLRRRFALKDIKVRPSQLNSRIKNYYESVWYLFTNSEYQTNLDNVQSIAYVNYFKADALATDLNALINRYQILLGEGSNSTAYVFSSNFYSGNRPSMTPLERATYDYITTRTVHIPSILDLVSQYRTMSDSDKFYHIPILIELISLSISAIKN